MLRKYFPDWLKDEGVEFALECLALVALVATILYQVLP